MDPFTNSVVVPVFVCKAEIAFTFPSAVMATGSPAEIDPSATASKVPPPAETSSQAVAAPAPADVNTCPSVP